MGVVIISHQILKYVNRLLKMLSISIWGKFSKKMEQNILKKVQELELGTEEIHHQHFLSLPVRNAAQNKSSLNR